MLEWMQNYKHCLHLTRTKITWMGIQFWFYISKSIQKNEKTTTTKTTNNFLILFVFFFPRCWFPFDMVREYPLFFYWTKPQTTVKNRFAVLCVCVRWSYIRILYVYVVYVVLYCTPKQCQYCTHRTTQQHKSTLYLHRRRDEYVLNTFAHYRR